MLSHVSVKYEAEKLLIHYRKLSLKEGGDSTHYIVLVSAMNSDTARQHYWHCFKNTYIPG